MDRVESHYQTGSGVVGIGLGRQGGDEDGSADSSSVDLVEVDILN